MNSSELRRIEDRKGPQKDLQKDTVSPHLKGCHPPRRCWQTMAGVAALYGVVTVCGQGENLHAVDLTLPHIQKFCTLYPPASQRPHIFIWGKGVASLGAHHSIGLYSRLRWEPFAVIHCYTRRLRLKQGGEDSYE